MENKGTSLFFTNFKHTLDIFKQGNCPVFLYDGVANSYAKIVTYLRYKVNI